MITKKELEEYIFGRLDLKPGQVVLGLDLWNHLVGLSFLEGLDKFLGLNPGFFNDSLISPDEFTRKFFTPQVEELDPKYRDKIFNTYRIADIKIINTDMAINSRVTNVQLINIYGNRKLSSGLWSKNSWVLFTLIAK